MWTNFTEVTNTKFLENQYDLVDPDTHAQTGELPELSVAFGMRANIEIWILCRNYGNMQLGLAWLGLRESETCTVAFNKFSR